jgi:hypothetical protein
VQTVWGGQILLFGPVLALLALRLRGRVRPLAAVGTAIVAEFVSLGLFIVSPFVGLRWHLLPSGFVVLGSVAAIGHHLTGLAVLALYGSVVAGLFLLVQWAIGRLTSAWSGRGV